MIYTYFDQLGQHFWTEKRIIAEYFTYWSDQMKRIGKEDQICHENCIEDWVIVNWAQELSEDDLCEIAETSQFIIEHYFNVAEWMSDHISEDAIPEWCDLAKPISSEDARKFIEMKEQYENQRSCTNKTKTSC